jgi:hypothetical protein
VTPRLPSGRTECPVKMSNVGFVNPMKPIFGFVIQNLQLQFFIVLFDDTCIQENVLVYIPNYMRSS